MGKQELLRLINDDTTIITEEIIEEASTIFSTDADEKCELTSEYLLFYYKVTTINKGMVFHNLHISNQKYILSIESGKCDKPELLAYFYLREIEYYLACNVTYECIHYVNKLLDIQDVKSVYKAQALCYGSAILFKNDLPLETEKYLYLMLNLYDDRALPESYQAKLLISIIGAAGFLEKYDIYETYSPQIEYFNFDSIGKDIEFSLKIYDLCTKTILGVYTHKQIINRLDELILFFNNKEIRDDLSIPFLPIFRAIQRYVSKMEIIGYAVMVIRNSSMLADRLAIYEYLINEVKVTELEYNGIHREYFKMLYDFYSKSIEISKQCIVNNLVSYDMEKQFKEEAIIDPLTGLGNRFAYETELKALKGNLPNNLVVVMFDLNGLKRVNDNFGHHAGDIILKEAAKVLDFSFKKYGKLFRIGGDEFILVAKNDIAPIAESIITMRNEALAIEFEFDYQMTLACGYATTKDYPYVYIDELIAYADAEMYIDKQQFYEKTKQKRRK